MTNPMAVISRQTERSPLIAIDGSTLVIRGRSFMSNALDYYRPVINDISSIDMPELFVDVFLEYFNTSSSKCFLEIFKTLVRKAESGVKVHVTWKYTDHTPEMQEAGEDYRDLLEGIVFDIVRVEE